MTPKDRTLVAYVIDEATDDVAETIIEAGRRARELHLWDGSAPREFDAVPDGSPRTVGVGLHFTDPFPIGDRPGLIRLLEYLAVAAEQLDVCLELQIDEAPIGLIAPEGIQPWAIDALQKEFGLIDLSA
ncbi:MAG: hypothetical protein J7513_17545 [Solirubrobacteraceae bacterium]|nr:hypothetical protein [Solirubrobacteraceae bacterium]